MRRLRNSSRLVQKLARQRAIDKRCQNERKISVSQSESK